jgi:hypothetical protein
MNAMATASKMLYSFAPSFSPLKMTHYRLWRSSEHQVPATHDQSISSPSFARSIVYSVPSYSSISSSQSTHVAPNAERLNTSAKKYRQNARIRNSWYCQYAEHPVRSRSRYRWVSEV